MMGCYDCGREPAGTSLPHRAVHIDNPDGGYDVVEVPICRDCIGRRFGFECPTCGAHYDDRQDAQYCCRRRPGEAPDCPHCGRRMERGAWGHSPTTGPTVEWAECECCPVAWGRFTGWHHQDDAEPCKHIDSGEGGESV